MNAPMSAAPAPQLAAAAGPDGDDAGSADPDCPAAQRRTPVVHVTAHLATPLDLPSLERHVHDALNEIGAQFALVNIEIVNDDRMIELHRQYSGIGTTTDVLTFVLSEAGEPIEADIAVCADVAARQASDRGHGVEQELLLYALHGMLHCVGHDDHTESGYAAMHAEEDRILDAIGVGETFTRTSPSAPPLVQPEDES